MFYYTHDQEQEPYQPPSHRELTRQLREATNFRIQRIQAAATFSEALDAFQEWVIEAHHLSREWPQLGYRIEKIYKPRIHAALEEKQSRRNPGVMDSVGGMGLSYSYRKPRALRRRSSRRWR